MIDKRWCDIDDTGRNITDVCPNYQPDFVTLASSDYVIKQYHSVTKSCASCCHLGTSFSTTTPLGNEI